MEIKVPAHAAAVLEQLERCGYQAWCVGGCVRDSLLGLEPKDWDVTTDASPEEIKACFSEFQTVDVGIRHGTVTVMMDGGPVEVTAYRSDGAYADHRHPESVTFSRDLHEDLARRDFTVNAMAYHPVRGIADDYGGRKDLADRVLRCVGQPELRFEEDALRILRCLRFSAVLGFSIHPETAEALQAKQELLHSISPERVREELSKLLCGANAEQVLREYSCILFTVLPELSPMKGCTQETPYHCYDVWEHTLHMLGNSPGDPILQWARLLHDCGKPAVKSFDEAGTAHFYDHIRVGAGLAEQILVRLRFSNRDRESVLALVKLHGEPSPIPLPRLKKLLARLGKQGVRRLLKLLRSDLLAQAQELHEPRGKALDETEQSLEQLLRETPCLTLRQLAVNGTDLLELGYRPGPAMRSTLNSLLDKVLTEELPNEKNALLQEAAKALQLSE